MSGDTVLGAWSSKVRISALEDRKAIEQLACGHLKARDNSTFHRMCQLLDNYLGFWKCLRCDPTLRNQRWNSAVLAVIQLPAPTAIDVSNGLNAVSCEIGDSAHCFLSADGFQRQLGSKDSSIAVLKSR